MAAPNNTIYTTEGTSLTAVANAIRTKGGTSAPLEYPGGYVSAIEALPTGGEMYADMVPVDAYNILAEDSESIVPDMCVRSYLAITSSIQEV